MEISPFRMFKQRICRELCGSSIRLTWCRFFFLVLFVTANVLLVLNRSTLMASITPSKYRDWTAERLDGNVSTAASLLASGSELTQQFPNKSRTENGFLIDYLPRNLCKGRSINLVIAVPVSRNNDKGRQVVRETWGSFGMGDKGKKHEMVLAFFLGLGKEDEDPKIQKQIGEEQAQYGDIVIGEFIDSYENLTYKSISILRFVSFYCNKSNYLLKADDDMYVNVPLLIKELEKRSKEVKGAPFVLGSIITGARPIRNKKNKWYAPPTSFKEKVYPTYVSGTAYSMSVSAAISLLQATSRVPFFWLEDIFITGLCTREAKIRVLNDGRFSLGKPAANKRTFQNQISGHRYNLEEIKKIHSELYGSEKR